jgi:uncharacterized protein
MIVALAVMLAAIAVPPAPKHYVTDTVGILSSSAQDKVENELRDFEKKTGDQVIVWIGDTTGDTPLEEWTVRAAQTWKIGHKGKDNGAVLFIFRKDRKARIEVGYGLEAVLTDAQSNRIIDQTIAPSMRAGNVDKAVQDGVDGMLRAIDSEHAPPAPQPPFNFFSAVGHAISMTFTAIKYIIGGLLILFVLFYFVFGELITWIRRGKRHGDWMDDYMSPIKSDQAAAGTYSGGGRGSAGGGGGGFSGGGGGFGGGGASGGW